MQGWCCVGARHKACSLGTASASQNKFLIFSTKNLKNMMNFTKKVFLVGALAMLTASAGAQMRDRSAATLPSTTVASMMKAPKSVERAPRLVSVRKAPADYGKEVDIVKEDFAKMTTGSQAAPDYDTDLNDYEMHDNAWINMLDDFTQTPGWGSHNAYSAGGSIYLEADNETQGQLNTPMLNVSRNSGICFLQFDARVPADNEVVEQVVVEAAETYNMQPSWKFLGNTQLPQLTTDWQTYTIQFYEGGEYTLFNIVNYSAPVLIDNVRVFQVDQYVATPTPNAHKNYSRVDDNTAKFDLSWSAVDGAESYVLNVYDKDSNGNPQNYIQKDVEVKDNKFTVDNAVTGTIYYYTVSAKKGEHVSMPSVEVQVKGIVEPVLSVSSPINGDKYTAEWKNVGGAERYNYISYFKQEATEDCRMEVSKLNLVGMKYDSDDMEVEYSVDNPSSYTLDRGALADEIGQAGWTVKHYAIYKDALTIDAFWTVEAKSDAGLISPEMDLSKDDGKFRVKLRACAEYLPAYEAYPQAAVALFNYDEEKGDYVQSELIYAGDKNVDGDWKRYDCDFTTGTARSIVGIYGTWAPGNLYLSDVAIHQNYKKGDSFLNPFHYLNWLVPGTGETTSVEVTIPAKAYEREIYHQAQSVRVKAEGDQFSGATFLESRFSDLQKVGFCPLTNGVNDAKLNVSGATVSLAGNNIVVNNPQKAAVALYTLDGMLVASDNSCAEVVTLPVADHGKYVVKVGKQSVKLVF